MKMTRSRRFYNKEFKNRPGILTFEGPKAYKCRMRLDSDSIDLKQSASSENTSRTEIAELRRHIDDLDDKICELLAKRIELSTEVMRIKPTNQTVDPKREQEIIERYFDHLTGLTTLSKAQRLVAGIIGASEKYPD